MNFTVNKKILNKCKKIRILLTDVDGVLTDGGMYYSNKGEVLKKFHARDGMGVNILRRNKIPTVIVTKEKTGILRKYIVFYCKTKHFQWKTYAFIVFP